MLKSLTPRQKQIAVALAGAAVLAVIALLSRGKGAAAAEGAVDPNAGVPAPIGSTFADNGEAAAGLSTSITEGLGNVALGLDSVGAQQSYVADSLNALAAQRAGDSAAIEQALNNLTIPQPEVAAPAAIAAAATARTTRPATVAAAAAKPKPKGVFTQTKGTRAGRNFRLVGNVRQYESAPGKADYGKKPGTKIARAPKPKPAPKPRPKPKAKARAKASPSRRPATTPRAPARKKRR